MPTYAHFQEAKKAFDLPKHDKVGVCLTCRFWDVAEMRTEAITTRIARCLHPDLAPFALIVSGSSACNAWQEKPGLPAEAKAYAGRGEET